MKKYLKYLISKPGKLAFSLLVVVLVSLGFYNLFSNLEDLLYDNSLLVIIMVLVLMISVLFLGLYQPYKEWKDAK